MMWPLKKTGRSPIPILTSVLLNLWWIWSSSAIALPANDQSLPANDQSLPAPSSAAQIYLDPAILENSPVLQRWLDEVPDLQSDLNDDPSFRSRLRLGYTTDTDNRNGGIAVGVEDIFVGRTGLTLSGDYQTTFSNPDEEYGIDLRYHLLPLRQRVNIAPVVGYRSITHRTREVNGVNLGVRMIIVPSRAGAADLALSQTWVNPGRDRQAISRFKLSAGYAITSQFRLSSDIHIQTTDQNQDTTVGLFVEWLL